MPLISSYISEKSLCGTGHGIFSGHDAAWAVRHTGHTDTQTHRHTQRDRETERERTQAHAGSQAVRPHATLTSACGEQGFAWAVFRIAFWTAVAGELHRRRWYWAL